MRISGRVQYQELEGGFWGILGDDGSKYMPVDGLPDLFRTNGTAVTAEVEIVHMIGTSMWGQYVKLITISKNEGD